VNRPGPDQRDPDREHKAEHKPRHRRAPTRKPRTSLTGNTRDVEVDRDANAPPAATGPTAVNEIRQTTVASTR
jgi:hypothetical protein